MSLREDCPHFGSSELAVLWEVQMMFFMLFLRTAIVQVQFSYWTLCRVVIIWNMLFPLSFVKFIADPIARYSQLCVCVCVNQRYNYNENQVIPSKHTSTLILVWCVDYLLLFVVSIYTRNSSIQIKRIRKCSHHPPHMLLIIMRLDQQWKHEWQRK